MRFGPLLLTLAAASAALATGVALSQEAATFPSKTVVMVDAQAPGGPSDRQARLFGQKMAGYLGQTFIVDSKPGAATTIAGAYVAKAKPDGYTLLITTGSFTVYPALYKNLSYDTQKDLAAVSQLTEQTTVLYVHPAFPAKNFAEYIAYAKANPGKINFAALGAGSAPHLGGAWLHSATNTQVTFIQYKGPALQTPDLLEGRVDVTFGAIFTALPLIKSGKIRALAIGNNQRSNLLPGLQTIEEQGLPGFNYTAFLGIVAPGSTPASIINKLGEGFARAAKEPDVAGPLETEGILTVGSTPAQFRQFLVSETNRNRKLIQDFGIKLEE